MEYWNFNERILYITSVLVPTAVRDVTIYVLRPRLIFTLKQSAYWTYADGETSKVLFRYKSSEDFVCYSSGG